MSIAEITGSAVPERWVEKVGRSIKGSDTPHPGWIVCSEGVGWPLRSTP